MRKYLNWNYKLDINIFKFLFIMKAYSFFESSSHPELLHFCGLIRIPISFYIFLKLEFDSLKLFHKFQKCMSHRKGGLHAWLIMNGACATFAEIWGVNIASFSSQLWLLAAAAPVEKKPMEEKHYQFSVICHRFLKIKDSIRASYLLFLGWIIVRILGKLALTLQM